MYKRQVSVARANNAIEKVLGVESEDITCLVFSIDKKVLLILKTSEAYKFHAFIETFDSDVQENELQKRIKQKIKTVSYTHLCGYFDAGETTTA